MGDKSLEKDKASGTVETKRKGKAGIGDQNQPAFLI
jgi:hypothetical protein